MKLGVWLWHTLLNKDSNGVLFLLVRQDLFDTTVDSTEKENNDSNETVSTVLTMITNKIDEKEFGSTKELNLQESLKTFTMLKEYTITQHWARLRLHLLNLPAILENNSLLHGKLWRQVQSQFVSIRHNLELQTKMLDGLECQEFRFFVHSLQQSTARIQKNQT